jgi:hypothetical protein
MGSRVLAHYERSDNSQIFGTRSGCDAPNRCLRLIIGWIDDFDFREVVPVAPGVSR